MAEEKSSVFLQDNSILPWEQPPKEGRYSLLYMYNGSTKLLDFIGFDTLDEVIGPYHVLGSTTKYLADIIHLGEDYFRMGEPVSGEEKREILFSGNLVIYTNGEIPGTKFKGYNFEKQGKIWAAREPKEQFYDKNGLKNLIFENTSDKIEQIESIIRGYEFQEKRKDQAQRKREMDSFDQGRSQGQDEGPSFHSGPC